MKRWFSSKSSWKNEFILGQLFLKFDKAYEYKVNNNKFQSLQIGPYTVHEKLNQNTYFY